MRTISILIFTVVMAASVFAQQNLRIGTPAPSFTAEALDGKVYNLDQLRGKVVVLTFWSTKCPICHSEIPKLNRVAERYRGKDAVFLALTMENQAQVEPYLKKNPFSFSIMPNSFGVVLKYANMDSNGNIDMGFPSYFLVDQKGAIALRSNGWDKTADLAMQIEKLLTSD